MSRAGVPGKAPRRVDGCGSRDRTGAGVAPAGPSKSGFTEHYLARLHEVRGEYAEAIPLLKAGRRKFAGPDLLPVDQALIVSYLKTGAADQAIRVARDSAEQGGECARLSQSAEANRVPDGNERAFERRSVHALTTHVHGYCEFYE